MPLTECIKAQETRATITAFQWALLANEYYSLLDYGEQLEVYEHCEQLMAKLRAEWALDHRKWRK